MIHSLNLGQTLTTRYTITTSDSFLKAPKLVNLFFIILFYADFTNTIACGPFSNSF